jgi:hypothetical protein
MPNWPITLNTITEGAIIKASDLESNFTKLKNAANTMHERFSTLNFSCPIDVIPITHEFQNTASSAAVTYDIGLTPLVYNYQAQPASGPTLHPVFGVFQVPSWVQALRVRSFDVLNHSILPNTAYGHSIADGSTPLEIGARYVSSLASFTQSSTSAPGTAIASVTFPVSGDHAKGLSGSYGASPSDPVVRQATPNVLVLGGQYIIVYGRGSLAVTLDDDEYMPPFHFRFHVNMMCDAMVPIP